MDISSLGSRIRFVVLVSIDVFVVDLLSIVFFPGSFATGEFTVTATA